MNLKTTGVFNRTLKAYKAGKRLIVNSGGTSSSKTYSALQLLVLIASWFKGQLLISVVSESFPHLSRGCIRDFKNIMGDTFDDRRWNASKNQYTFGHNRVMEFFSADQPAKLRGGRRDILFINEANNVAKEAFDELDVRTRICTFIDFNPVAEFWAHELQNEPFVEWIHSTYLDALEVIERSVVQNILSRKDRDPNWWRVYGLGMVGKLDGLIHPEFTQCDVLPEKYDREIYGLDFGFSQDQTALVQIRIAGERLYCKELIYELGMTNQMIADRFDKLGIRRGYDVIIADSAEPKSIEEIHEYGFDIRPCVKGKGSVHAGIQKVNQYKQYWTKDSLNSIKEQRNWQWEKDKDGKFTTKPMDGMDHSMSARRYAVSTMPAPKVLPGAEEGIDKSKLSVDFEIDFDHLSEFSTLIMSIWVTKNLKTYVTFGLWNSRRVKYYVFGELAFDHPRADKVLVQSVAYLRQITNGAVRNLRKFQIWGNEAMHSPTDAEALNDMADAYQKYNMIVNENFFWDEMGAILLVSRLAQRNGLAVHERCEKLIIERARWTTAGGKPEDGYGFARSLCNAVSACVEASRYDPPASPVRPFSEESQARNKVIDQLAHADPDKFDNMADEEIEALVRQRVSDSTDGVPWMS